MDAELFETLGQVAGVGGIALGVLLVLFKEILGRSFFPKLTREQASRLLNRMVFAVWSVAVLGLVLWFWSPERPQAAGSQSNGGGSQSVGAGRDISDSEITIEGGGAGQQGVKAGRDISGSEIKIKNSPRSSD